MKDNTKTTEHAQYENSIASSRTQPAQWGMSTTDKDGNSLALKEDAKSKALKIMLYKERTAQELLLKLKEKGYHDQLAKEVTDHFVSLGYINDAQYAEKYIKDAINLKGWGRHRIHHELIERGVDCEIVEEKLEQFEFDDKRLVEMIRKKINRSDESIRNHFVRKGYTLDQINDVLKEMRDDFEYIQDDSD